MFHVKQAGDGVGGFLREKRAFWVREIGRRSRCFLRLGGCFTGEEGRKGLFGALLG